MLQCGWSLIPEIRDFVTKMVGEFPSRNEDFITTVRDFASKHSLDEVRLYNTIEACYRADLF